MSTEPDRAIPSPLRFIVLEYLCGSGLFSAKDPLDPLAGLIEEGAAMLFALAKDIAANGHSVSVLIEPSIEGMLRDRGWNMEGIEPVRLPPGERIDFGADQVSKIWIEAARRCDGAVVIAPEFGNTLARLIGTLRASDITVFGPDQLFLECASDKYRCNQRWLESGCRASPTWLGREWLKRSRSVPDSLAAALRSAKVDTLQDGWVIKRRWGAGGTDMHRFQCGQELARWIEESQPEGEQDDWIVQPWIRGTAASLAMVGDFVLGTMQQEFAMPSKQPVDIGCVASGVGEYIGGRGPLDCDRERLVKFAKDCVSPIPGSAGGWVGIDFLILENGDWLALEINARLTSSYHGYRQWYGSAMARAILGGSLEPVLPPAPNSIRFRVGDFMG